MSLEKKHWARPRVHSIDRSNFRDLNRDKLVKVRDLVQHALELVEASDDAPDAAPAIRAALDQIDEELAK